MPSESKWTPEAIRAPGTAPARASGPTAWQPANRSDSRGDGDGRRPNPGAYPLLQSIEADDRRSEESRHLSTRRYFGC
jgi:hypothetical protein